MDFRVDSVPRSSFTTVEPRYYIFLLVILNSFYEAIQRKWTKTYQFGVQNLVTEQFEVSENGENSLEHTRLWDRVPWPFPTNRSPHQTKDSQLTGYQIIRIRLTLT